MTRIWLFLVAAGVAMADLLTKLLIVERLPIGSVRPVIDGWFSIVHIRTPGAAFGLGAALGRALPWPLIGTTATIAAIVMVSALRTPVSDRWTQIGFHLVLGGAIGNIVNRLMLGPVVDFLDFYVLAGSGEHHWPAFNVADGGICAGIGVLPLAGWRGTAAHEGVA